MTREFYNKYKQEIEAWARGEEVEAQGQMNHWVKLDSDAWAFDYSEWQALRLKPKRLKGWVRVWPNGGAGAVLEKKPDRGDDSYRIAYVVEQEAP